MFIIYLFFKFCFEARSHYVAQAGLKLMILLLQPPKCWDYKYPTMPSSIFFFLKNRQQQQNYGDAKPSEF
jgi:hypothetical protein